jgi:hypothetical protein
MIDDPLKTHDWSNNEPREIKIEGKSIFHHHCRKCTRDFARESSQTDWKAVYIGPFTVKFLDDSVSQQWLSEPCPWDARSYGRGDALEEARGSAASMKVRSAGIIMDSLR